MFSLLSKILRYVCRVWYGFNMYGINQFALANCENEVCPTSACNRATNNVRPQKEGAITQW